MWVVKSWTGKAESVRYWKVEPEQRPKQANYKTIGVIL